MTAFLGLKIDVDTLRGTHEGVPRLLDVLQRHDLQATFLFSLGPDHTGRAIRRVFRKGFVGKVRRTSVVRHYGMRTLKYHPRKEQVIEKFLAPMLDAANAIRL